MQTDDNESNNNLISMNFDEGGNYLEVAEKSTLIAEEYSSKLFTALLAGSGISFLTLGGYLAGSDTSSALKSLYLYSLWYFAISLVLTFVSGVSYSVFQAMTAMSQRNLHNSKAFQRIFDQANNVSSDLTKFDEAAKQSLNSVRKDTEIFQKRAVLFGNKSAIPLWIHAISYIIALLFFCLGIFTPLFSVTFYDYF